MSHGETHGYIELIAALVLVVGGSIAIVALWLGSRGRRVTGESGSTKRDELDLRSTRLVLASTSLGAGIIHLALWPEHVEELGWLGWGFLAAGIVQIAWAALATRPLTPRRMTFGIAFNALVFAAWAASRTIGLPTADAPWMPEAVGNPDLVAGILEVALIAGLLVSSRSARDPASLPAPVLRAVAVAVVPSMGLIATATILVLAGPGGH